eukprot:COSAG01_NODE_40494_length_463_cov_0.324176_1_plen_47_part_01
MRPQFTAAPPAKDSYGTVALRTQQQQQQQQLQLLLLGHSDADSVISH